VSSRRCRMMMGAMLLVLVLGLSSVVVSVS